MEAIFERPVSQTCRLHHKKPSPFTTWVASGNRISWAVKLGTSMGSDESAWIVDIYFLCHSFGLWHHMRCFLLHKHAPFIYCLMLLRSSVNAPFYDLNKLLIYCNDLFLLFNLKFGQGPSPETVGRHQKQFPTAYLSSKEGQKGDRRPLPLTVGEGCCGGGVGTMYRNPDY